MTLQKRNSLLLALTLLLGACNNEKPAEQTTTETAPAEAVVVPTPISYNIVNQYPHDPKAFTEGLEFHDGFLYESVGQYGESDVRKVELTTGKVLQSTKMDARYFGEGLTLLNDKFYQLTYREGKGFIYNAKTLKQEGTFPFPTQEGWGMTNNGTHLIFNDGGNVLYFMDPANGNIVKQLPVTDEHGPVYRINEMELIKGFIYANQWQLDLLLKIDTATGKVVGRADLSGLRQQTGIPPLSGDEDAPEVLNGIAYDATANRIFITGKNWPKLLEVKLDN
jgi:glutamine cyclotransferase